MCYHFQDHDTEDYIKSFMSRNPQYKSYVWQDAKYYVNGFAHGKNYVAKQGGEAIETLEWGLIPFGQKQKKMPSFGKTKHSTPKPKPCLSYPAFATASKTKVPHIR